MAGRSIWLKEQAASTYTALGALPLQISPVIKIDVRKKADGINVGGIPQ